MPSNKEDMPDGCVCDPEDWDFIAPPPICVAFIGNDVKSYCERCTHEYKCHEEGK